MTTEQYKALCNQPIYRVAFARLKEDVGEHKKGGEFPIYLDSITNTSWEVSIMIHEIRSINIARIEKVSVELFEKEFTPKYKLGDIVYNKEDSRGMGAFRVWEYYWDRVEIAYRSGWGVGTDLSAQVYESNLRLATEQEGKEWNVEYNDSIVKERKPELYASILTPIQ
jgi:hypothetical protein